MRDDDLRLPELGSRFRFPVLPVNQYVRIAAASWKIKTAHIQIVHRILGSSAQFCERRGLLFLLTPLMDVTNVYMVTTFLVTKILR